jgi:hypothetical protein
MLGADGTGFDQGNRLEIRGEMAIFVSAYRME